MSSRNPYLYPDERQRALILYQSLQKAKELYEAGERKVSIILKSVKEKIESIQGVVLQYVEVRDAETLGRIENLSRPAVIAVAAIIGNTRLIDNIVIGRQ
jgi:pantoate--beta-alanine ligase